MSVNLRRERERLLCAACEGDLGAVRDDLYDTLHLVEHPVERRSVHGLRYRGSERFVLRHFCCPHCATQLDVQIGRVDEPVDRAVELSA